MYVYVCICMCVCICMYMYVCIYVYMYISFLKQNKTMKLIIFNHGHLPITLVNTILLFFIYILWIYAMHVYLYDLYIYLCSFIPPAQWSIFVQNQVHFNSHYNENLPFVNILNIGIGPTFNKWINYDLYN